MIDKPRELNLLKLIANEVEKNMNTDNFDSFTK